MRETVQAGVPFMLFEDARPGAGPARLYHAPRAAIAAWRLDDVAPALAAIRAALHDGAHVAGWLSYEAGAAFESRLRQRLSRRDAAPFPLLWFGVFDAPQRLSRQQLAALLPDPDGAFLSPPRPRISRGQYREAFARAKDYIVAGDIYQINLSYRADVTLLGAPSAAYAQLRSAGQGGWSALAHDGANWLVSTSPELFFRLAGRTIEARPMKGTAKRSPDVAEDRAAAEALQRDPKQRAENVMIVDLLRNDISRLAQRGSVHVPELFAVETYPTLHTLTSTVRAEIKPEHDAVDALAALFPCGSITGAPKIRAMEIIDQLERDRRGPYTGSIGWISPEGEAEFNVAIRTLAIANGRAELGLGSAIVLDSTEESEWEECSLKGAFLTARAPAFHLIETMRFDPGVDIARLDLHLARLQASARALGFAYAESAVRAALDDAVAGAREACIARLTLSQRGQAEIELKPLPAPKQNPLNVALALHPFAAEDFRRRHKTTLRAAYDTARDENDEVVFIDKDGRVSEGSFTNIFVERDGALLTPPATRGLLPGALRNELLNTGRAREAELTPSDLANGFLLGNSVRGLMRARLR